MLIDEIIALLSSDKGSITEALLKTKILLHQIGHRELIEWVNSELNGYADKTKIPPYRMLHARVLANFSNIAWRYSSHPIPLGHLKDEQRENLENIPVLDSLAIVADLVSDAKGALRRPIPMEANYLLGKGLQGTSIQQAWCELSRFEMQNIVFQVRSRLLDFILELNSSLGSAKSEDELKRKSSAVDATSMFNKAIFGANTTIIVGSNNVQKVDNTIIHGDFNSLAASLKELGIADDAVDELRKTIDDEKAKGAKLSIKGKIGDWIRTQVEKQFEVGAQAAVNLSMDAIIHAIKAFI